MRRRPIKRAAAIAFAIALHASLNLSAADIEVTSSDDAGAGTLREALSTAVAGDRIVFNIPGGATITLASDLPDITDSLSFTNVNVAPVIVDLDGNNPINVTGGTIDLGELQVTELGTDVILGSAVTWIGDDDLISADIQASGTIAPGDSSTAGVVGTLDVSGDIDASNSTLELDVVGGTPDTNDVIQATGEINVTGATLTPNFVGLDYSVGKTFTVIDAGTVTGALNNAGDVFALPSNPFLEGAIAPQAAQIDIVIQDNGLDFVDVVDGCNQLVAAAELDRLRVNPPGSAVQAAAITVLRDGSTAEVAAGVNQLSATIYPSLVDAEINAIQGNLHSIRDRVLLQREDLIHPNQWTPWIRGFGTYLDAGIDDCLTPGYTRDSAGIELGTGRMFECGLGIHGFGTISTSETRLQSVDQQADSDSYRLGGTVQYLGEVAYVFGASGFGFQDHEVNRSLSALGAVDRATSDFDGSDVFNYLELGTAYNGENSLLLLFTSLQSIQTQLDGAAETGGGEFAVSTAEIDEDSLRSMIGASLSKTGMTGIGAATTQVRVGWLHEFNDSQRDVQTVITSADVPAGFAVQSTDAGRDWLSLGGQLDWSLLQNGHLTLAYQGNLNSGSSFQSGFGGVRWRW
ncbi:autotransporter family protein [Neorhodopirellula lusitana]|uniref:autotransporter family protein n=1 Tax=Neorhodopirellula lusitana TaxID=445327 RepID=UPI00384F1092